MKKIDLKILLQYANRWVGLDSGRSKIIASGSSLIEVNEKLKKRKIKDAIVTYIIPPDYYVAPLCQF